jgi:transcriptional regulator with XRE-family HTH domain
MIIYIGRKVREEKGFSVRKLAKESTIAVSSIYKYEAGYNLPMLEQLDILAKTLGCGLNELIQYEPN